MVQRSLRICSYGTWLVLVCSIISKFSLGSILIQFETKNYICGTEWPKVGLCIANAGDVLILSIKSSFDANRLKATFPQIFF